MERIAPEFIKKEAFWSAIGKGILNGGLRVGSVAAKPLLSKGGLLTKGMYLKGLVDAPKVFKKMPSVVGRAPKIKRMI